MQAQTMPKQDPGVTELLVRWSGGEREVAGEVLELVYEELRRIAARQCALERPDHTLQATAVVHEAYLQLRDVRGVRWRSRAEFLGFAAHLIRRVLVDHAREHGRVKRGGRAGTIQLSALDLDLLASSSAPDLVTVDEALTALARLDPRKAEIVELRFFGGLTQEETAAHLGVSQETVGRHWRRAKAWLRAELDRSSEVGRVACA